jgi:ATP/maltotriose-dependent transcriptional regulator MalT
VLRDLGRLREAEDYSRRAEAKAQQNGDAILATQAELQQARIFRDQHEFARASIHLTAVELRMRQQLPPGHYGFAALSSDKSLLAQAKGDLASALRFANQALAIDEASIKAGGQGSIQLPMLLVRRSAVELALGDREQAEADASRAVSLLQARLQPGTLSNNLGRAYLALARAQQSERKASEATVAFRSAAEHLEKTLGPDHPDTRSAMRSE